MDDAGGGRKFPGGAPIVALTSALITSNEYRVKQSAARYPRPTMRSISLNDTSPCATSSNPLC
jgi:hypothetical protein